PFVVPLRPIGPRVHPGPSESLMAFDEEHDSGHEPADDLAPVRRIVLSLLIGLYLLGLGALLGVIAERMRFDQRRASVLARYEALLNARRAAMMTIERDVAQRSFIQ